MSKKVIEKIRFDVEIILDFLIESIPIEKLSRSDAIFVFGHVKPEIAQHAAKLYQLDKALKIILTGKGGESIKAIPDFDTEAEYYAEIIEKEGIPKKDLILENKSTNSLENVLFGIKACQKVNFNPKSLILVAAPPLLRRSCATFRKQFPAISVCGSDCRLPAKEYLHINRIQRLLDEFKRFEEYSQKGDIECINIPEKINLSIKRIKSIFNESGLTPEVGKMIEISDKH